MAIPFDTLKLAQTLRDKAKFSSEQAEQTASALAEAFGDWQDKQQLVTKADLAVALAEIKTDLIKWLIGVSVAQGTLIIALLKFHA